MGISIEGGNYYQVSASVLYNNRDVPHLTAPNFRKEKKNVVTKTAASQNARRHNEVHSDDGKWPIYVCISQKQPSGHLAQMSLFQRLKCHQRSHFSSGVHEDEYVQRTPPNRNIRLSTPS